MPALLPRLIADWSLTNTEAGWLAGIPAGYMLWVLLLALAGATASRPEVSLACLVGAMAILSRDPRQDATFSGGRS